MLIQEGGSHASRKRDVLNVLFKTLGDLRQSNRTNHYVNVRSVQSAFDRGFNEKESVIEEKSRKLQIFL